MIGETPEQSTQMSSALIAEDATCIHCNYNLRGLPADGRCPECGLPISESRMYADHRQTIVMEDRIVARGPMYRHWRYVCVCIGALLVIPALLPLVRMLRDRRFDIDDFMMFMIFALISMTFVLSVPMLLKRRLAHIADVRSARAGESRAVFASPDHDKLVDSVGRLRRDRRAMLLLGALGVTAFAPFLLAGSVFAIPGEILLTLLFCGTLVSISWANILLQTHIQLQHARSIQYHGQRFALNQRDET